MSSSRHVAISGASGLVGRALARSLRARGDRVTPIVRRPAQGCEIGVDAISGQLNPRDFEAVDAVVHLAGEPIVGRWTPAKKNAIRTSRVDGTAALCEAIAACASPPRTLVCASAVGWYGAGRRDVHDGSDAGHDFLANVAQAWEAAADPARAAGLRVSHARFAVVLSARGGALPTFARLARLGLAGRVGDGLQGWPYIHLDDAVGMIITALDDDRVRGPFIAAAPHPVTQIDAMRTLRAVVGCKLGAPAPAWAVRALLGELGEALVLDGPLLHPTHMTAWGYSWQYATLHAALEAEYTDRASD